MVLFGNQQNMKPLDTSTMLQSVSSVYNLRATCI